MIKIFADAETTGLCSYNCEVIEFYFEKENGESHHLKSRVNYWSEEAFEVHKIPKETVDTYDSFNDAWKKLTEFLPNEFEFIFFANSNAAQLYGTVNHGYNDKVSGVKHEVYFDKSLLIMNLMDYYQVYHYCQLPYKIKFTSVYDIAKEADKKGVFKAISKSGSNKKSFSQKMVYKALFGESYHEHDAKADTKAMIRIYDELNRRVETNEGILI